MPRFSPGKCFYCRVGFNKPMPNQKGLRDTNPTKDHVYAEGNRLPPKLPSRTSLQNIVRACLRCNKDKGGMHPLKWLTICPSDAGAADLATLLLKLGEPENTVKARLLQRKLNAGNPIR